MEKTNLIIAILMAVVALCSLTTALLSYFNTKKMSQGQMEIYILQQINDAERHKDSAAIEYKRAQFLPEKKQELELSKCIFESAVQQLLNVYDEICGLYIDKKVDKKRFIKSYGNDIITLVEANCYAEFYKGKDSKSYKKTLYVYDKLTNQI